MKPAFNKRSKILIGIVVVVLVVVLLNVFQREVRGFFYYISAPIQKVLLRAGESMSDFFWGVFRAGNLKNKADELELKNQELLSQIIVLNELQEENKNLREALNLELQKDFKLSLAQIISKDVSQNFILINKGSKHGISKDIPVITEQKVLIGRIKEVYKKFSKVMLISHKDSSFDAEFGVIKGQGNFKLLYDFIPKEKEIARGDIVITSALGNIFPKGLLVGKVKKVKKSDVESFQQAEIDPFFDISQTEKLFIILEF